ncbi:hypothetical protein MDAP_002751 [Mitosporidium daphniae]
MAMAQDTDTDTDTDVCNSQADCGLAPHTPITFSPVSMSPKEFFSFVQNTYLVDESRPDRFISFPSIGNHGSSPDVIMLSRSLENWIQDDLVGPRTLITLPIDCPSIASTIIKSFENDACLSSCSAKICLTIGHPSILQSIAAFKNSADMSEDSFNSSDLSPERANPIENSPLFDSLPNLETLSDLLTSYTFFVDVVISLSEEIEGQSADTLSVEIIHSSDDAEVLYKSGISVLNLSQLGKPTAATAAAAASATASAAVSS